MSSKRGTIGSSPPFSKASGRWIPYRHRPARRFPYSLLTVPQDGCDGRMTSLSAISVRCCSRLTIKMGTGSAGRRACPHFCFRLLVQKHHVTHGLALVFGVHEHPVPHMQADRLVIGMTNASLDVGFRVTNHASPLP